MSTQGVTTARLVRWGKILAALCFIGVSLAIDQEGLMIVAVLFVLVVPFEKLFPRHDQRIRRPQLGTDIGYALAGPLLTGFGVAVGVVVAVLSLAWLPGLAIRPLVALLPPAVMPFVGLALFDLLIYWTHRWYHEVPILWRFHAIHHSPTQMDWISGFRNHPLDGTLIAPAFIFLLAAGFSPEFTGALAVVQIVLGIFLHANVRWRLRPLHRIVITPEFHHWHHANEPGAINSNYSVFLPLWDMVFDTYFMPRDRRPQVYGVTEPVPAGMVDQLRYPFRGCGNPLRWLRHPIRALGSARRGLWLVLVDMKRSATRPRRSAPGSGPPPNPTLPWPTPDPTLIWPSPDSTSVWSTPAPPSAVSPPVSVPVGGPSVLWPSPAPPSAVSPPVSVPVGGPSVLWPSPAPPSAVSPPVSVPVGGPSVLWPSPAPTPKWSPRPERSETWSPPPWWAPPVGPPRG